MRKPLFGMALAGLLAGAPAMPAWGQGAFNMGMITNTNAIPASTQSRAASSSIAGVLAAPGGVRSGGGLLSGFKGGAPVAGANASYGYTPTAAIRKQTFDEFVARLKAKNPEAATAMQKAFAGHDYASIYQGIVSPFGLKMNDLADSLTAYVVLGWMVSTGAGDPSPDSVRVARAQIAAALARDNRFSDPTLRAKVGEEFKLLFVTVHSGWLSARKEGNVDQYAKGVAQMFRTQTSLDLTGFTLGAAGFQRNG